MSKMVQEGYMDNYGVCCTKVYKWLTDQLTGQTDKLSIIMFNADDEAKKASSNNFLSGSSELKKLVDGYSAQVQECLQTGRADFRELKTEKLDAPASELSKCVRVLSLILITIMT
ncbi:uncharacterized protein LOC142358150 [Convolutriloba macropyga]|uniref:uncharacterized protein LOC142358150 n=1 Tax=Convolutriloba macropyga TaxID=536237 RepID=UPI003F51C25F